jgi:hypothetical protein
MIPKVIHYVWVGNNPLGTLQKQCIASWKQHLSDYTFTLWNEENVPAEVLNHSYVQAMSAQKKWAFVADFIRFWALEREGGIYLDTDTEVLKSFDSLLAHTAFFGKTKDGVTAAGVIGAVPHHQAIADILKVYEQDREYTPARTSPRTVTDVLATGSYPDVTVYDYQYFNPCDDGEVCTSEKLAVAYTKNHWAESWVPYARLRKIARRLKIMSVIKFFFRT